MEVVLERIGAEFGCETEDLIARQAATAIITAVADYVLIVTVGRVHGGEGDDLPLVEHRLAVLQKQAQRRISGWAGYSGTRAGLSASVSRGAQGEEHAESGGGSSRIVRDN